MTNQSNETPFLRLAVPTLLLLFAATLLGLPLRPFINPTNLVMLYLAVVMITAVRFGQRPAIVASLLSVIIFDVIFVPPYNTLVVNDAEYIFTFIGLLAVGLVISTLATRAREQALAAKEREAQTAVLYELSQGLAAAATVSEIAQTSVTHARTAFNSGAALIFPHETEHIAQIPFVAGSFAEEDKLQTFAASVCQQKVPAGRYTSNLPSAQNHYFPVQTPTQVLAVLALTFPLEQKMPPVLKNGRFLASFANQIALSLERLELGKQAQRAQLLEETEKLHNTLLNSISHDLRTPLASVTGALSSLVTDDHLLSEEAQLDLLHNAYEQSLRLNRLVGNLLDMTRVESGALKVMSQPYDVQELVGATLAQLASRLEGRIVNWYVPNDLPPVMIDLTLMVQALVNLVDNAAKYAPVTKPIEIEAKQVEEMVQISVKDRGNGLPEGSVEQLFSKFYRSNPSGIGGTGLGLAITKGIVEAHNGRVFAANRPNGGAVFSITVPIFNLQLYD